MADKRLTIYLKPDQVQALDRLADEIGVTRTGAIRIAVGEFIRERWETLGLPGKPGNGAKGWPEK
jgi:predicted transcriptional regulator